MSAETPTMAVAPLIRTELQLSPRVIRTNGELRSLGPAWKELFQRIRCDNVFLSFEWLSEWWFHLGQRHQLFVITLHHGAGHLAAVAPLYISRQAGPLRIRRLGFLGDRLVGSDYLDFLLDDGAALDDVCRQILRHRREWDYIEVSSTRVDSIAASQFAETMQRYGMSIHVAPVSICPYVSLPETPDAYLAGRSSMLRNTIQRSSRSLGRGGDVEFTTVSSQPQIQDAFDDVVRLHGARFQACGRKSAFLRPELAAFHRSVLTSLSMAGRARVHLMKLCGRTIAGLYGFSVGRNFFFYQSGFDPAYSRFSVGTLVLGSAIRTAIETGHSKFDFLRGTEPYKRLWADNSCQLCAVRLFDDRARSITAKTNQFIYQSLHTCISVLGRRVARWVSGKAALFSRARIAKTISRFGFRLTLR